MNDMIKMDIVLDSQRLEELVPGYDDDRDRQKLVDAVADHMGFDQSEKGGWVWKITPRKDSTTRLVGRFVPVGASVLA